MTGFHIEKDLIILSSSEEEHPSENHEKFNLSVSLRMHEFLTEVINFSREKDECAPCALLSMTSTLMGNIFLAFETAKDDSSGDISKLFHDMVEHTEKAAKEHRKNMEDFAYAENKLDVIYAARRS